MTVRSKFKQCLAAVLGSLSVLCCGSAYVWPAPLISKLQEKNSDLYLNPVQLTFMVSIADVGNILTPLPCAYLSDMIGRKTVLLITAPFYLVSGILVLSIKNPIVLIISRFLQGLANGTVFAILPLYLGELAESTFRGTISIFFSLFLFFGMFLTYLVGEYFDYYGLSVLITVEPIVFLVLFVLVPETPHYYLLNDQQMKAAKSLRWFRGAKSDEEILAELMEIEKEVKEHPNLPLHSTERIQIIKNPWQELFTTRIGLRALALGNLVVVTQVTGGIYSIFTYAADSLNFYKSTLSISGNQISMIFTVVTLIFTYVAIYLVDKMGRRPLLLISGIVSFTASSVSTSFFFLDQKTTVSLKNILWVLYVSMIVHAAGNNFALGALMPTLQAELFPTSTRSLASSIMAMIQASVTFVMLSVYLHLRHLVGEYFNFFLFTSFLSLGTCLIYLFFPETKGKTFKEIQEMLS